MTPSQILRAEAAKRILIKDGAYGTLIQDERLQSADYRGGLDLLKDQTRQQRPAEPDAARGRPLDLREFADAGAEMLATNTLQRQSRSARRIMAPRHLVARDQWRRRARSSARSPTAMRRKTASRAGSPARSVRPTRRCRCRPTSTIPAYREVDFDQVKAVYREQIDALVEGGVDFILIETIFDTLNAKAAIMAALEAEQALGRELPLMISMTLTDLSGRNLSGHTVEGFWARVRHARPLTIGLNCSFGAAQLRPHLAALSAVADTLVMAYPNAGLPNELGEYDEAAARNRRAGPRVGRERPGQHRRRLLRDNSRAHRRNCRGGARLHAARRPGCPPAGPCSPASNR